MKIEFFIENQEKYGVGKRCAEHQPTTLPLVLKVSNTLQDRRLHILIQVLVRFRNQHL